MTNPFLQTYYWNSYGDVSLVAGIDPEFDEDDGQDLIDEILARGKVFGQSIGCASEPRAEPVKPPKPFNWEAHERNIERQRLKQKQRNEEWQAQRELLEKARAERIKNNPVEATYVPPDRYIPLHEQLRGQVRIEDYEPAKDAFGNPIYIYVQTNGYHDVIYLPEYNALLMRKNIHE